MSELTVKDFVTKDNVAYFDSFRAGFFYYTIYKHSSDIGYQFQIPLDDIGTATLKNEEKSVFMMRWIRKSIEDKTLIKL
jgi:hypothetical protein